MDPSFYFSLRKRYNHDSWSMSSRNWPVLNALEISYYSPRHDLRPLSRRCFVVGNGVSLGSTLSLSLSVVPLLVRHSLRTTTLHVCGPLTFPPRRRVWTPLFWKDLGHYRFDSGPQSASPSLEVRVPCRVVCVSDVLGIFWTDEGTLTFVSCTDLITQTSPTHLLTSVSPFQSSIS